MKEMNESTSRKMLNFYILDIYYYSFTSGLSLGSNFTLTPLKIPSLEERKFPNFVPTSIGDPHL